MAPTLTIFHRMLQQQQAARQQEQQIALRRQEESRYAQEHMMKQQEFLAAREDAQWDKEHKMAAMMGEAQAKRGMAIEPQFYSDPRLQEAYMMGGLSGDYVAARDGVKDQMARDVEAGKTQRKMADIQADFITREDKQAHDKDMADVDAKIAKARAEGNHELAKKLEHVKFRYNAGLKLMGKQTMQPEAGQEVLPQDAWKTPFSRVEVAPGGGVSLGGQRLDVTTIEQTQKRIERLMESDKMAKRMKPKKYNKILGWLSKAKQAKIPTELIHSLPIDATIDGVRRGYTLPELMGAMGGMSNFVVHSVPLEAFSADSDDAGAEDSNPQDNPPTAKKGKTRAEMLKAARERARKRAGK